MIPIGFAVGDVVEQVDRARERAEDAEGGPRIDNRRELQQTSAEHDPREHEQVLGPLFGPERGEQQSGSRLGPDGPFRCDVELRRYTLAEAEKLRTASASLSYVSKTVSSFVIDRRSVIRFVRLSSLRLPPCLLIVV